MTRRLIRLGLAALMVAGLASADTLYVNGFDPSLGLGAALNTNGWLQLGGTTEDFYYYGAIDVTIDGYARTLFCIDPFTDIYNSSVNSSFLTLPGTPAQGQAAWLLNKYWPDTTTLPTVLVGSTPTTATSAEVGAAIQLGLWDVVENNSGILANSTTVGLSVDNTNPATTATDAVVADLAQSYVNASIGQSSGSAYIYNNFCTADAPVCNVPSQTLIGLAVNDGGPTAPEPATIWMFLTGGIFVLFARYRKQCPNRASL
jgi:hypothetical protein